MEKDNQKPAMVQDFQELATFVGEKFEQVDRRFEQVDKRFDKIEIKIDSLEEGLGTVKERLDGLDAKFDKALSGIDKILQTTEAYKQESIVGAAQLRRHTDMLDDHEQRIKKLELRPQE